MTPNVVCFSSAICACAKAGACGLDAGLRAAKKNTSFYCRHGELCFSTFFLTRFSSVLGGLDCFSLVIISLDLGVMFDDV